MAIREDPEGVELQTVLKHARFTGKEVLEVGCGDGRLTFKFADMAKSVVALDPVAGDISKATESMPKELLPKVNFLIGRGEKLPFPNASFDVVFFTWSLCAMSSETHMEEALDEARRVLRPGGLVLNLQPSLQQPFHWGDVTYLVTKDPAHLVDGDVRMDAFNSRYAIKRAALIEERFHLIAEEEFTGNIYFDTIEEAVEAINEPWKNEYDRLDEETKLEIRRRLRSRHTPEGVRVQVNGVVTVLRKLQPG
ncbi:MAG: methyltransferase domain-containing protein [Thermoplasmata archaeon]